MSGRPPLPADATPIGKDWMQYALSLEAERDGLREGLELLEKRRQREVLAVQENAEAAQERMRQELVRVDGLRREAEVDRDRLWDALRYIVGYDVAGYEGHLRSEDVARSALNEWSEDG